MSTKKGADSAEVADFDNDEYVAQLLAKDARESSLRYSAIGMNAFIPLKSSRPSASAPKPNTRFLKNILRETDSHNASLKRKEEEEARERMRALRHGQGRSSGSKPERSLYDVRAAKRRRVEASSDQTYERGGDLKCQNRGERGNGHTSRDRGREGEQASGRREGRAHEKSSDDEHSGRHKSPRSKQHKREDNRSHRNRHSRRYVEHTLFSEKYKSSDDDRERRSLRRKRHHSHSRSPSQTRRHSSERLNRRKERLKDLGESQDRHLHPHKHRTSTTLREKWVPTNRDESPFHLQPTTLHSNPRPQSQSQNLALDSLDPSDSDSDPLESLIGPLPPSAANDAPPLRSRGRGAYKNKSNIDAHFASGYDPALDVHPDDDDDRDDYSNTVNPKKPTRRRPVAGLATADDDWDMALEALRDRALWKRKGADRLREAGFDEGVVEKWAGNGAFAGLDGGGGHRDIGRDRDRDVDDVKWAKKGEKREWDRGKVLTDDGHIDVRPKW